LWDALHMQHDNMVVFDDIIHAAHARFCMAYSGTCV
jgi:hypothetical protein